MIIGEIGDPLERAASNLAFTIRQTKIELQRMMYEDLDLWWLYQILDTWTGRNQEPQGDR